MEFSDWWKAASERASREHYEQRLSDDEIAAIKAGRLTDSARQKIETRRSQSAKRDTVLFVGCLLPLLLFALLISLLMAYLLLGAVVQGGGSIFSSVVIIGFVGVGLVLFAYFAKVIFSWRRASVALQNDLRNAVAANDSGPVRIDVRRTRNNFSIHYSMNGAEYSIFDDAIGWEIHQKFFDGSNISGPDVRESLERFRFYFLPQSKLLLHFEVETKEQ